MVTTGGGRDFTGNVPRLSKYLKKKKIQTLPVFNLAPKMSGQSLSVSVLWFAIFTVGMTVTLRCENEMFSTDTSLNKSQEKMDSIVFRCGFDQHTVKGPHNEQKEELLDSC